MRELEKRKSEGAYVGTFKPSSHFFGYEGRCAMPSNFDTEYCYALGMNAAYLMKDNRSGYISCIKNLGNPDPTKWIAGGCPLPTMMHIERRKGKDKPVIAKAVVLLDGAMFKCYEAVRKKWAYLDCYQSPGPIQFKGTGSEALNFMVRDPDIDLFVYATEEQEKYESRNVDEVVLFRQGSSLSALSRSRIRAPITIPNVLKNSNYRVVCIKNY